jgi:hypothetical protein
MNSGVFGSVVMVVFQSVFRLKIHQNNIFFNSFFTSVYQNDPKSLKKDNLKKKNQILTKKHVQPQFQTEFN